MMLLMKAIQALRVRIDALRRYKVIIIFSAIMLLYFVGKVSVNSDIDFNWFSIEDENCPVTAFTFDDGPHPGYARSLVKILGEENIKATFFIVGKMALKHPDLVKHEYLAGHEIGNHTYSDTRITTFSEETAVDEIEKTQNLIKKITGKPSRLLRPPGGHYNGMIVDIAKKHGYEIVLWTLNPNDIVSPPAGRIYHEVVSKIKDEDIVIFHSGIDSTLEALPSIIRNLKEKGFKFVTVSELLEIKKERLYANSGH